MAVKELKKSWQEMLVENFNAQQENDGDKIVNLASIREQQRADKGQQDIINKYKNYAGKTLEEARDGRNSPYKFTQGDVNYRAAHGKAEQSVTEFYKETLIPFWKESGIFKDVIVTNDKARQVMGIDAIGITPDGEQVPIDFKTKVTQLNNPTETYMTEIDQSRIGDGGRVLGSFMAFDPDGVFTDNHVKTEYFGYGYVYSADCDRVADITPDKLNNITCMLVKPSEQWKYLYANSVNSQEVYDQAISGRDKFVKFYNENKDSLTQSEMDKHRKFPLTDKDGKEVPGVYFSVSFGKEKRDKGEPIYGAPVNLIFENKVLLQLPSTRAFDASRDGTRELDIGKFDRNLKFIKKDINKDNFDDTRRGPLKDKKPISLSKQKTELQKIKKEAMTFKTETKKEQKAI